MPEKSSIGFSGFEKLIFLVEISNFSAISEISKIFEGGAPALRVIRAGTRLTVHRSLPYRTAVNWRDLAPRRSMILVDFFMFLMIFCIMSYWFVTFRCFILYWRWIPCDFQLSSSIKPLFWTGPSLFRNVEKMIKFSNFDENFYQKLLDLEIYIREAPHEGNLKI